MVGTTFFVACAAAASAYVMPAASRPTVAPQSMRSAARVYMQEINLAETATAACDGIMQMLSDDAQPPKSMMGVKDAVSGGEPLVIGAALYDLICEQALDYDSTN